MAKPPKPTPEAGAPALPDLRKTKARKAAHGLTLLAYDEAKQVVVPVTLEAVLAMAEQPEPDPNPYPSTADDKPLAEDDGVTLTTDDGQVLSGDIR